MGFDLEQPLIPSESMSTSKAAHGTIAALPLGVMRRISALSIDFELDRLKFFTLMSPPLLAQSPEDLQIGRQSKRH